MTVKAKVRYIYGNGDGSDPTGFAILVGPTDQQGGKWITEFYVEDIEINGVETAENLAYAYADGYNHCLDELKELLFGGEE